MPKRRAPARPAGPCSCGLPSAYGECCGRLHRGETQAKTAEQLMRSRYSAFAVQDSAYLLKSWHPTTRPPAVGFEDDLRWDGLEILGTSDGSPFHTKGTVEFRAHYTQGGRKGQLHELSTFTRHDGAWVYLNGTSF
ncbi:YchJ family metal-binding protein [Actinomadura vinacea]|uniref:UPF0225 protein GCM10010191_38940 n=1 Tax=Actinomadura vinacea TaxID=115336 RepID=A0ABP5WBX8_9ACTN